MTRAANVPDDDRARVRGLLRHGERPVAAAMCSLKGESVDDTLLVATTQRVIWTRRAGDHRAVEASELARVSAADGLTLELRNGGTERFSSWQADQLRRLGSAARALIEERG